MTCHSFIHSCIHSPPPSSRNFNFARVPRRHTEAPCRPPLTPPRSATTTRGTTAPSCARTTTPSRVTAVERRARARKKHPSARDGEARRTRRARVLARRTSASRPVPRRGTIVREVRRRRRIITRRRRRTGRSIIERAGDRVLGIAIIRRRRRRRMDTARTMRTMRTMGTTRATARTMGTGAWRLRLSRFRRSVARRRRRRPGTVARRPSRGRLEDRRDRRRMSRNPRARRRRRTRTMDTIRTSLPIYSSRGTTRAITRGAFRGEVSSDGVIRINNQSVVLT